MENLLPVVNQEIGFSVSQSIPDVTDKEFVKQELKKIKKENPVIANVIARWANLDKGKIHTAYCGIMVYKLLRSQAEVDKMEREIL